MIEIGKLDIDVIGRWVEYIPKKQKGRIKSYNNSAIFVVYQCDNEWYRFDNYTAVATKPEDLKFI